MDLDRAKVVIRPRTAWEGVDLGCAMARQWFLPLWGVWWVTALPLSLLWLLVLPQSPWLAMLLVWWCKPLYEPPLVFWLSRALFDERVGLRDLLGRWRQILTPQLVPNLTWRRLAPMRSFYMPVAVLEGLKRQERKRRNEVLGRRQQVGAWLTLVGLHFEFVLEISLLVLLVLLVPDEQRWIDLEGLFLDPGPVEVWVQNLVDLLAMSVIAPFYVAAGFALYLTRRSELEGWDIELGFRRLMAGRGKVRRGPVLAPVAMLALVAFCDPGSPALAADLDREEAGRIIAEVLADDDFGGLERVPYWKYVGESEAEASSFWSFLADLLSDFAKGVAVLGEALLWLFGGLVLGYLIYQVLLNRGRMRDSRARGRVPDAPVELFGLDVRPQSLPPDVAAEARRLLDAGRHRDALSLLYRGALTSLMHAAQVEVPASATEGECVALVATVRPAEESGFFRLLTSVWLRLAYGHLIPPEGALRELCRDWPRYFASVHE